MNLNPRRSAAIILTMFVLAAFLRLLFRTDYVAGDDVLEYAAPFSTFFWQGIARGDLPVWNPYQETGVSAFGYSPWMGPFYPLSVLYAFLPAAWAFNAGYLFHLLLAAAGCYRLARRMGLERPGSVGAATVLALSSEFVYRINQGYLPDTVSVSYLPWLVFCIEGIAGSPGAALRNAALLSLFTGLMLTGGHTTHNWMVLFSAVLYSTARFATVPDAGWRGKISAAAWAGAGFAAGFLAGGVQVLPTLHAIAGSPASGGREFRQWAEFVNEWWRAFFIPFLGAAPNLRGAGFAGVIASALAILGAAAWRRHTVRLALFVLAAVSYLFFVSPGIGLYGTLAKTVPTFRILSYTYLFQFPVILTIALCAGRGLDLLIERAPTRRESYALAAAGVAATAWAAWYVAVYQYPDRADQVSAAWVFVPFVAAGAALGAALYLRRAGLLNGASWGRILVALAAVETTAYVWHASEPPRAAFRPADYFAASPLTDVMKRRASTGERFRFWDLEVRRLEDRRVVKHHQPTIERLEEVSITSKLPRTRYAQYSRLFGERLTLDRYDQEVRSALGALPDELDLDREGRGVGRLLAVLNVRYILSDLTLSGGGYVRVLENDGVALYENADVPPRAYLAERVFPSDGGGGALETILQGSFDPRRDAVLETQSTPGGVSRGKAGIVSYRDTEVRVRVSSPSRGVLVLLDPYDPDWRAEVAGRETAVMRANYLFRAVEVPSGDSEVVFRYRPVFFHLGAAVSLLAAVAVFSLLFSIKRTPA